MFDPESRDYIAIDPDSESVMLGMVQAVDFDESRSQAGGR